MNFIPLILCDAALGLSTLAAVPASGGGGGGGGGANSGGGGGSDAAGAAAASAGPVALSVWELVVKGGWMMIPIGICSLVAMTIIVERFISLRRASIIPPRFLPGLQKILSSPDGDAANALNYCKKHESPASRVCAAAIRRLHEPLELLERHIAEAGERETRVLRRRLRGLAVIASVSPLLGLLGTIFGMISAFQTVAGSGDSLGRAELLAGGIYEALITTAAGLLVAIPALLFHHYFAARIERLVFDMDAMTVELIESHAPAARSPAIAPSPSAPPQRLRTAASVAPSPAHADNNHPAPVTATAAASTPSTTA